MATANTAPTEDEVRAAEEVIQRNAEAQAQARREALKPILAITSSKEFQTVETQLKQLDQSLFADGSIGPHLRALTAGVYGLRALGNQYPPAAGEG